MTNEDLRAIDRLILLQRLERDLGYLRFDLLGLDMLDPLRREVRRNISVLVDPLGEQEKVKL